MKINKLAINSSKSLSLNDSFLNKQNVLASFFSQFINYLIPFLLLIFLFRLLDESSVGYFVGCQSLFLFILLIFDYGLSWDGVKRIVQKKTFKSKITVASELLSFQFSLISVFYSILILFSYFYVANYWIVFLSFFLFTFGNYMMPIWIYHGLGKFYEYATIRFFLLIFIIIFFIILADFISWKSAIFSISLSNFCSGLISFFYLKKKYNLNFFKFDLQKLRKNLNFQKWLFLGRFSSSLYTTLIPFLLIYFVPSQFIAYFSIAEKFKNILQGIFIPIHQLLLPFFSKLYSNDINKYSVFIMKFFFIYIFIILFLIILGLNFSSVFIKIFIVTENKTLDILMKISLVLFFLVSLTNFIGFQIMIPKNLFFEFGLSLLLSSLCGLMLFYFLTNLFGIIGSSVSIFFTELLVLLFMSFFMVKNLKK